MTAAKRLMRDLQDIQQCPLTGISAMPIDDNLFLWHCNVQGPTETIYAGTVFHVELQFPRKYPSNPPKLRFFHFISHQNVFRSFDTQLNNDYGGSNVDAYYICLDILEQQYSGYHDKYSGWSTGYSVKSILLQLQSFIFEDSPVISKAVKRTRKLASSFVCPHDACGHSGTDPKPSILSFEDITVLRRSRRDGLSRLEIRKRTQRNMDRMIQRRNDEILKELEIIEATDVPGIHLSIISDSDNQNCTFSCTIRCPKGTVYSWILFHFHIKIPLSYPRASPEICSFFPIEHPDFVINHRHTASLYRILGINRTYDHVSLLTMIIDLQNSLCGFRKKSSHKKGIYHTKQRAREFHCKECKFNAAEPQKNLFAEDLNELMRYPLPRKLIFKENEDINYDMELKYADPREDQDESPADIFVSQESKNMYDLEYRKDLRQQTTCKLTGFVPSEHMWNFPEYRSACRLRRSIEEAAIGDILPGVLKVFHNNGILVALGYDTLGFLPIYEIRRHAPLCIWTPDDVFLRNDAVAVRIEEITLHQKSKKLRVRLSLLQYEEYEDPEEKEDLQTSPTSCSRIESLRKDLILHIFQFLHLYEIDRFRILNNQFQHWAKLNSRLAIRTELVCFHTKFTYKEDLLGFGVLPEYYQSNLSVAPLKSITVQLDPIGKVAFEICRVRRGLWKDKFTHWIPLYISKRHGKGCKRRLPKYIRSICQVPEFSSSLILDVLPVLMNTMVVDIMAGSLHESIAALRGYTAFYHLFLATIEWYPELESKIDSSIGRFMRVPNLRSKRQYPSLGNFIPLLTLSNEYQWKDLAHAYLTENFTRCVKWIMKDDPENSYNYFFRIAEGLPFSRHLVRTFLQFFLDKCLVSIRLLIFHVHFLRVFRYDLDSGLIRPRSQVKSELDVLFGRPPVSVENSIQAKVKSIKEIQSWPEFFSEIGLPCPPEDFLYNWLRECVEVSANRGYHRLPVTSKTNLIHN